MADEDIVISGFSAYFPQADHLVEFREKLYAGVDMVTEDDLRWPPGYLGLPTRQGKIRDVSRFDAQFFNTHPKQAHVMDPQLRMLLETSYEAIVDAGYDPDTLSKRNIGVFIGNTSSESGVAYQKDAKKMDGYFALGCCRAMFSNRVSFSLDVQGPSMTIDTACTSSMVALCEAVLALRSGRCEAAIVGGANLNLDPHVALNFKRLGVLSEDGKCKTFDASEDGYVRSEAIGCMFLQRISDARRIYAKVINANANTDGYKPEGIPFPSAAAHELLLRATYAEARVDPRKVEYVEAHGTGTKIAGPQELAAISNVLCPPEREKPLKVGSVKSNMGHAESACGIASVAKVILAMETGTIAANLHFKEPRPDILSLHDGRLEVVARPMPFDGGLVGISSQGIGGTNTHAIFEPNQGPHAGDLSREKPELPRLVLMAGRSKESLLRNLNRLEAEGPYPDSTYALLNRVGQPSVRRWPCRGYAILPVNDSGSQPVKVVQDAPPEKRPLCFVFSSMGCQWNGMARQMMHFGVFAHSIRESHALLEDKFGVDLIDIITSDKPRGRSMISSFVAITAIQVALVDMLHALGLKPDGIVGHSVGEVGCSYADGALTAEQAVLSSYWRGRCTELTNPPKGCMAAVGLTWEEAKRRCPPEVHPACHNAEDSVTVSGPAEAMEQMIQELQAENVFARKVNSMEVAFHSKHVEKVGPILREVLNKVIPHPKPRSKRWISSSVPESRWHEPASQLCSAEYHTKNFLNPVLFREALLHVPPDAIVLEIGPHCLLQAILRRSLGPNASCLGLMKRGTDNLQYFLDTLGQLHTLGVKLDLSVLYPPVPWPLPRGTPNIAHLVSWDHSQSWAVPDWKEFSAGTQAFEEIIEIDINEDSPDNYLLGHQPDGRPFFPGTGYLVLAWKSLAKQYGRPFNKTPVIFEDVKFQRLTVLPQTGSVRFQVTTMPVSGEFEVCESRAVVAKGRIRMAEEGEEILRKEPPGTSGETVVYDMDASDVYKELRLRGYMYYGAFQCVLEACSQSKAKQNHFAKTAVVGATRHVFVQMPCMIEREPCARIRWDDNWLIFLDAVLHISIMGYPERSFDLPVSIQSCRIDPKVQEKLVETADDKGVVAVYCPRLQLRRGGGVEIEGLQVYTAQRRPIEKQPVLEQYVFVPYRDDETARKEQEHIVREYADVCCAVALRVLQPCEERENASSLTNGFLDHSECTLRQQHEKMPSNYGLLQFLLKEQNQLNGAASMASTVKSAMLASRKALEEDLLNTSLVAGTPLRYLLDVVVENTSSKNLRVLELANKGSVTLMAPWVSALLSVHDTHLQTVYSIVCPSPESLPPDQIPGGAELFGKDSSFIGGKVAEAELVIASCTVISNFHDLSALTEEMASQCKERGFALLSHRTALTEAEALLSKASGVPFQVYPENLTAAVFKDRGFRLVGSKSNNLATLLLFRKVPVPIVASKQEVIMLQNRCFSWIETLKEKLSEHVGKSAQENIWLLAEDAGTSGILGFTNCLLQETGGRFIRCVFDATTSGESHVADFCPTNPAYKDIIENDLVMNVYRDGLWGSFRHRNIPWRGEAETITQYALLHFKTRSDLSSLQWYESSLKYLSPSEKATLGAATCDVYYAPVNFHDVVLATGKANMEGCLGKEFSGRDSKGRRVMGVVEGKSLATVLVADPFLLWEVPDSWTLQDAATVPVAYTTAYYALVVRGDMQPGETVLVHAGAGGVGQAAIAVALAMGCTVFTTVGSDVKREFLKRRFPQLQDRHFANSRDTSFEEHIKWETKGRERGYSDADAETRHQFEELKIKEGIRARKNIAGEYRVDLVLNSLSEDKLQASIRCLAAHGRFLEIGKFDLIENNSLGMSVFLDNVTFHGIMIDVLMRDNAVTRVRLRRVQELVRKGIESGVVRPLDVVLFSRDRVEEAFRFVASGKHMAKAVIQIRPEETGTQPTDTHPLTVKAVARPRFYGHKSYIIVGGLGGFGLELAEWMVSRGCRKLILISRTGVRTGYQRFCLKRWSSIGATVLVSSEDVSTEEGARNVIDKAATMGPVGGIFNLAMVLRDALFENQTAQMYEEVLKPKVVITQCLDDVSRERCPSLDHFVVFSSLASGRGNAGQTNYGYANSVMERMCECRASDGLPGLAIQWGAIGDVGVLSDDSATDVTVTKAERQPIRSCMEVMDAFLSQRHPVVSSFVKYTMYPPLKCKEKRKAIDTIARILGMKDPSRLNPHTTLSELGIDSLMVVEIRQLLERDYQVALAMQEIRQLTVGQIRDIGGALQDPPTSSKARNQQKENMIFDSDLDEEIPSVPVKAWS